MVETLLVPLVAVSSLGWSVVCALRGDRAVAIGAAVMAGTLGLAAGSTSARLEAWAEGGPGMSALALVGSYGLGAAAAFLVSGRTGARWAALVCLILTGALSAFFYFDGLSEIEEVLRQVNNPIDAASIREGSRAELMRLVELGGALIAAIVFTLLAATRTHGEVSG